MTEQELARATAIKQELAGLRVDYDLWASLVNNPEIVLSLSINKRPVSIPGAIELTLQGRMVSFLSARISALEQEFAAL